jgi:hypothetical protein
MTKCVLSKEIKVRTIDNLYQKSWESHVFKRLLLKNNVPWKLFYIACADQIFCRREDNSIACKFKFLIELPPLDIDNNKKNGGKHHVLRSLFSYFKKDVCLFSYPKKIFMFENRFILILFEWVSVDSV